MHILNSGYGSGANLISDGTAEEQKVLQTYSKLSVYFQIRK